MPRSVVKDATTIPNPTLQVHVWAENAIVGVSQIAANTMAIWRDMGPWTTQWIDNGVRERDWEIAQTRRLIRMISASLEQWNHLIDFYLN